MNFSTVGASIVKCHNTSIVLPLPKQNLLFSKLIRLYLHVHKNFQLHNFLKDLRNLPTRL